MSEIKKSPKEYLKNLEDDFNIKINKWTEIINNLASKINCELKQTIDLVAEATAQRQIMIEERTHFYFLLYKNIPQLKKKRKDLFEWYSTKYQIKTNGSEKKMLIESDISYVEIKMEFIQNYINFLTDSIKTIDHVIYSMKNKIDLYNATGLE